MAQARRTKKKAKPSARENVRKRKVSPPKARPKARKKAKPTFQKSTRPKAKASKRKTVKATRRKPIKATKPRATKPKAVKAKAVKAKAVKAKKTARPRRGYSIAKGRRSEPAIAPSARPKGRLPKGFVLVSGAGVPLGDKKPTPRRWTVKLAERTATALRKRVQEIQTGLTTKDWGVGYEVHAYPDQTIDGELRVTIPRERSKNDVITSMVLDLVRLARPLETFPAQYVSHGMLLGAESQNKRREAANPYKRYKGQFRLNVHWQNILDSEQNAKTMLEVMRRARKLHKVPPTGILVRWAWSADGLLHRGR